jgi:hypothetical protein
MPFEGLKIPRSFLTVPVRVRPQVLVFIVIAPLSFGFLLTQKQYKYINPGFSNTSRNPTIFQLKFGS